MKAFGIAVLVLVLLFIISGGIINLRKRGKEKDKAVTDAAEAETTKSVVVKASGVKPVNITKVFNDLNVKTNAFKAVQV